MRLRHATQIVGARRERSDLGEHFDGVVARLGILHGDEADGSAAHGAILDVVLMLAAPWVDEGIERLSTMRAGQHGQETSTSCPTFVALCTRSSLYFARNSARLFRGLAEVQT